VVEIVGISFETYLLWVRNVGLCLPFDLKRDYFVRNS